MLDLGFIHALKRIVAAGPEEAPDPVLLGDHAQGDPASSPTPICTNPAEVSVDPGRDHRRADRPDA